MINKILLLSCCLLMSFAASIKAQNAITTYTFTPNQVSGVNVSTFLQTSGKQINDFPTNSIFPVFSRDSSTVQWFNVFTGEKVVAISDSTQHYYTGGHQFLKKDVKGIDSFFHCCMLK